MTASQIRTWQDDNGHGATFKWYGSASQNGHVQHIVGGFDTEAQAWEGALAGPQAPTADDVVITKACRANHISAATFAFYSGRSDGFDMPEGADNPHIRTDFRSAWALGFRQALAETRLNNDTAWD